MDKSEHDQFLRWKISLHESAHLVTAVVLSHHRCIPSKQACAWLLPDNAGLTHAGYDEMANVHNVDSAVYAAAGEHGERLVNRFRPPRLRTKPATITPATPPTGLSKETFKAICKSVRQVPRDSDYVRAFCTQTRDGNLWSKRYKEVHKQAAQIIKDHRREVIAIARKLYEHGLVLSRDIAEIMPPIPLEDL
jgi:hypothetical protein